MRPDITIDVIVSGARAALVGCLGDHWSVNYRGRGCDNPYPPCKGCRRLPCQTGPVGSGFTTGGAGSGVEGTSGRG
ncbi:MAG: hypothetical protein ACOVQ6_16705, partial [Brevundimonas sp.]